MAKVNQYDRLAEAIDNVSNGFPKAHGIERWMLKTMFTEEDAKTFADMIPHVFQTPKQFAEHAGVDEDWASEKLHDMSKRGLIMRRHAEDGEGYEYEQIPLAFGLVEFQALNMTMGKMLPIGLWMAISDYDKCVSASMPLYRSVPFKKDLVVDSKIMPYDNIEEVLDKRTRFAVAPCVCRLTSPKKCGHPLETCIMTDDMATFYIENGWGREITREEALEILQGGAKDGRIIQIANAKNAENICSCCKCGCGLIDTGGRFNRDRPVSKLWSNYRSVIVNPDACVGCGACEKACTWGVMKVVDGKACLPDDMFGCLGCGLCASNCPAGVIKIMPKDEADKLYEPPETMSDAYAKWHKYRVASEQAG